MTPILHVVSLALALTAYVILTITGHDGNPALLFIGGQIVGATVQAGKTTKDSPVDSGIQVAPKRSTLEN